MSGRDLIGVAPTGSGKTLAYLLPMFEHCKAGGRMAAAVVLEVWHPLAENAYISPNRFTCI